MEHVGGLSAFSPQTLFSVDNFIHYMTVSLEMLMNEVKKKRSRKYQSSTDHWGFRGSLGVSSALQVPRMIVNVVQILPMQTLREVRKPTPGCLLQRWSPWLLSSWFMQHLMDSKHSVYILILLSLSFLLRSFCSCLIEPEASSPELRELIEVNLTFQVWFLH